MPDDDPALEEMLRRVFHGIKDDKDADLAVFHEYFDYLRGQVRKYLSCQARVMPGESAVVQSALFSMFCDLAFEQITEEDEHGYPMLWPLLLKYFERHGDKWKKYGSSD
jgi:hypothetical protein